MNKAKSKSDQIIKYFTIILILIFLLVTFASGFITFFMTSNENNKKNQNENIIIDNSLSGKKIESVIESGVKDLVSTGNLDN